MCPKMQTVFMEEPHSETDEDFTPLQAADLYAWHLHRDYVETQLGREHKDSVWDALKGLRTYPHFSTE